MADRLVIERLEFEGYCGVTDAERMSPQPMAVDLELAFDMSQAAATDDLACTVDYTQVAEQIMAVAQSEPCRLLETLAERLTQTVLTQFPVAEVDLWVRKLKPPMQSAPESVGVRISRQAPKSADIP